MYSSQGANSEKVMAVRDQDKEEEEARCMCIYIEMYAVETFNAIENCPAYRQHILYHQN